MLTQDDLQAIRQIVGDSISLNNKVFSTILKVELAETNKRIDNVAHEVIKINKKIDHLEERVEVLEVSKKRF
jgi:hypothetical protein